MPSDSAQADSFTPRPTTPRLAPLAPEDRNEAQRTILAKRPPYNIFTTLAHHPEFYTRAWTPLGAFLLDGSSLPARERELVMLRMGWLCQSEYEWSQHARISKSIGALTDAEVHRIAEGPDAAGWTDFERTLLRMVDELRYAATISDATWQTLRTRYSDQQVMEALFTAGQYQQVSMILNSLGIQLDAELQDRLPRDLPLPPLAARPAETPAARPRIAPLAHDRMTPEQRELVRAQMRDGTVLNFDAVMVTHPRLYDGLVQFDTTMRSAMLLPAKARALLILRTAWNLRAGYLWAHHVQAAKAAGLTEAEIVRVAAGPLADGWSEDQVALLRAADELRREAFISNAAWQTLSTYYDKKQMVEIIATISGYTISGLAINSLGIQVEPGSPAMPKD